MDESKSKKNHTAPVGLKLLVTIVSRQKAEFFADMIQGFGANMQAVLLGEGTATVETLQLLGLTDREKAVIFSVLRSEKAAEALDTLAHKFETVRNGKGVAWTVPLDSTIGVAVYRFLSNNPEGAGTKWNTRTK